MSFPHYAEMLISERCLRTHLLIYAKYYYESQTQNNYNAVQFGFPFRLCMMTKDEIWHAKDFNICKIHNQIKWNINVPRSQ